MIERHQCPLEEGCELLKRIASNPLQPELHRAIAKALVKNEAIATTLHEKFGIVPLLAAQLAAVLADAREVPPKCCYACNRNRLAA